MIFRGSSGRSAGAGWVPSPGVPPKTELDRILEEPGAPLGDTDLDPDGVDVDAKRDETDALELRYGNVDVEDDMDWGSGPRSLGNLNGEAMLGFGVST